MPGTFELKIKEIIQRTPGVKSFRLEAAGVPDYKAGQFLLVSFKEHPELKRYLSISSSPTESCHIEFTKKITQSQFSQKLDSLKPGESLLIQYPFGRFTLEDNPSGKIAFLSGGIGITPIRSICRYIVDKNTGADIVLLYANRSIRDIIFREDFDSMERQYPGLKVAHVLCEPAPGFKCSLGLINSSVVKKEVPDYLSRKFFLCGPPGMVEAMKKILAEELKLAKDNIVTENFQGY